MIMLMKDENWEDATSEADPELWVKFTNEKPENELVENIGKLMIT